MRKIEQEMLDAISCNVNWSKDNTRVESGKLSCMVYLHGHHIASVDHLDSSVTVNKDTLMEYPTNTTKSRLRALGVNVCTIKGVIHLDNKPLV